MSQIQQPPVAEGNPIVAAPTPPPEQGPPPSHAQPESAGPPLAGSMPLPAPTVAAAAPGAGAGLIAAGGLLTPGGTPSLAEVETSPLASVVTPQASPAAAAAPPTTHVPPPSPPPAAAGLSAPTPSQSSALPPPRQPLGGYLTQMTALERQLRQAEQAGDERARESLLRAMQSIAYQAWLDNVYVFDAPTDSYYFLLLALLRLTTNDLAVALHLLNSAKASLKAHPFAYPLASLVSGVNEGRRAVCWESIRRLKELLTAIPAPNADDAAFRAVFSTILEVFYSNHQESVITLLSETYASLPLRQFAAEVDLQPGEVVQAARNLGWKVDESAGLVMPVKRKAVPGQAFGSPDFDRLARRVLALEEAIRVD